jgi:hypothetical protein
VRGKSVEELEEYGPAHTFEEFALTLLLHAKYYIGSGCLQVFVKCREQLGFFEITIDEKTSCRAPAPSQPSSLMTKVS